MPRKPDALQRRLDAIRALRDDPTGPGTVAELRRLLKLRTSHVVAAAAEHVADFRVEGVEDELVAAYDHFSHQPIARDPGCTAKVAVVRALDTLQLPRDDVFRRAARHVQLEPSWGPPVDTAAGLRSQALVALVNTGVPDAPVVVAERLADPLPPCRSAAIRALMAWGDPVLLQSLLRLRLLDGEEEPDLAADAFEALLALRVDDTLELVLSHLEKGGPYAEPAALALGTAREASALPALIDWWRHAPGAGPRRIALVSIGLLRTEEALAFLLDRVREDSTAEASAALDALGVFAIDPGVRQRILDAAAANRSARLDEALARLPDAG